MRCHCEAVNPIPVLPGFVADPHVDHAGAREQRTDKDP